MRGRVHRNRSNRVEHQNRALLPGSRVIRVNVSPGKPVLIRKLDIRFSGSGEQQAEVVQLMRVFL